MKKVESASDTATLSENGEVNLLSNDDGTDCAMVVVKTDDDMEHVSYSSTQSVLLVDKVFQCEQCDKSFTQASNLKRHERTHTGERPFSCPTCGRCFAQGNNLKAHMRLHTGERPYACTLCDRTFAQSSNMYKHMRHHADAAADGETTRRFGCAECGKWFLDCNMLRLHLRTHTGERPYACDQCDRTFTQESNLRRHRRVHTGEKPYKCPICGRGFSQSNNAKAHMAVHGGVAVGECMTVAALKEEDEEMKVDDQEMMTFACEDCGDAFATLPKLRRHKVKVHTGPKIIVINQHGRRLLAKPVQLDIDISLL